MCTRRNKNYIFAQQNLYNTLDLSINLYLALKNPTGLENNSFQSVYNISGKYFMVYFGMPKTITLKVI